MASANDFPLVDQHAANRDPSFGHSSACFLDRSLHEFIHVRYKCRL